MGGRRYGGIIHNFLGLSKNMRNNTYYRVCLVISIKRILAPIFRIFLNIMDNSIIRRPIPDNIFPIISLPWEFPMPIFPNTASAFRFIGTNNRSQWIRFQRYPVPARRCLAGTGNHRGRSLWVMTIAFEKTKTPLLHFPTLSNQKNTANKCAETYPFSTNCLNGVGFVCIYRNGETLPRRRHLSTPKKIC